MRLINTVLAMRKSADVINVDFCLRHHATRIDSLNLIDQVVFSSAPVMDYHHFPFVFGGNAFGR
jgi:hypothetical protein